ncbi:MAG: class I SAM-dependent methyltransferase, partial [Chloroflexota bacterium]|nr:class I SAM-dependent methyltransferase [Chloroflexota bacterium]
EVLYPGCSIHISPAFVFPYVVFVDQDPAATEFFFDQKALIDLIKQFRKYRRNPYIQFIPQDFTKPLPLRKNQFDLLLSLYTGGVSKACKSHLKTGGYLVTNNHHNDAIEAYHDNELTLIAAIEKKKGKYCSIDIQPDELLRTRQTTTKSKRYLRKTNSGVEYIENEVYYIFQRSW